MVQGIVASAQPHSGDNKKKKRKPAKNKDKKKNKTSTTVTTSSTTKSATKTTPRATQKSTPRRTTRRSTTKGTTRRSATKRTTRRSTTKGTTKSKTKTTTSRTTTTTTTTTSTTTTTTTTTTPTTTNINDLFEVNLFNDIKPWTFQESDSGVSNTNNKAEASPDPFGDIFDLSSLRPQSPFVSNTNKNKLADQGATTARISTSTTKRSTINIDGFVIGNPVGLVTTTTPRTTVAPAWSWSDGGAAGESGENLQPSLKTDATAAAASSPSPTSPATTTTQETTTKLLSSWYQDLFADLLAANSKTPKATPRPRPSTAPPGHGRGSHRDKCGGWRGSRSSGP